MTEGVAAAEDAPPAEDEVVEPLEVRLEMAIAQDTAASPAAEGSTERDYEAQAAAYLRSLKPAVYDAAAWQEECEEVLLLTTEAHGKALAAALEAQAEEVKAAEADGLAAVTREAEQAAEAGLVEVRAPRGCCLVHALTLRGLGRRRHCMRPRLRGRWPRVRRSWPRRGHRCTRLTAATAAAKSGAAPRLGVHAPAADPASRAGGAWAGRAVGGLRRPAARGRG